MDSKQVIVIRKDLKMRRGKECAQAAHASMMWLIKRLGASKNERGYEIYRDINKTDFTLAELHWMATSFKKVCVQVDSIEELMKVYEKAEEAGLLAYLITDAGHTEFGGKPTVTCLAIGPNPTQLIDEITGDLKLY